MSSAPTLTTTSYAILGLLAVKPWTTHELVQQVDRSLRRIWPRAQSKLYEEPKKLVAHGYARATDDSVGRRPPHPLHDHRQGPPRAGRLALTARRRPRARVRAAREDPLRRQRHQGRRPRQPRGHARLGPRAEQENLATARAYLEGRGAFPERAALNQLPGRFLTDFYVTVARWVDWATRVVDTWPDDVTAAPFDAAAAEEAVRSAESVTALSANTARLDHVLRCPTRAA